MLHDLHVLQTINAKKKLGIFIQFDLNINLRSTIFKHSRVFIHIHIFIKLLVDLRDVQNDDIPRSLRWNKQEVITLRNIFILYSCILR